MAALTVFLATPGVAGGIKDVLKDLSAVGLIRPFLWVDGSEADRSPVAATRVEHGREYDTTIEEVVASQRILTLRLSVLVPLTGQSPALSIDTERRVAELLASTSGGARVVRLRLLLGRPGCVPPTNTVLALDGWHNILIAPEDARGPGMGHIALSAEDNGLEIGRHAAPVVAAVSGLWADVEHAPFDDKPVLPGNLLSLTRSFYRRLDTSEVENSLRRQIFEQDGQLPLPREGGAPVTYIDDVQLATHTMARNLWDKHRAVLMGDRVPYAVEQTQIIGFWAALKMFFSFLGAALRNAPAAWYARVVDSVSSSVAGAVHSTVFGENPSAYEVVANGRTTQGRSASWFQVGSATHQLRSSIESMDDDRHHAARADLSDLWQDYSRAAMTLADGGARSAELPPVQIGASRGVLRRASDVVPGPAEQFDRIPGVVAATVEVDSVDATDVIGASQLRSRLSEFDQDASLGIEARRTGSALDEWRSRTGNSFAVAVGTTLARNFDDRHREVKDLLARLRAHADRPAPAESKGHNKLARWIQITSVILVLVIAASAVGIAQAWFDWWIGALVIVGSIVLWIVVLVSVFLRGQRDLFQDLNRRKTAAANEQADEANLRTALRDLDRLSDAYSQYLSWSRALGAFLAEPLGPNTFQRSHEGRIAWGLPKNTAIGYANPHPDQLASTAEYLRQDLFGLGWLSTPWERAMVNAGESLGSDGRDIKADPTLLWRAPGSGSASSLDRWSRDFFRGSFASTGAALMWDKARTNLMGPKSELVQSLTGQIEVLLDGTKTFVPLNDFLAGVADAPGQGRVDHFDRGMVTDLATTQGMTAVKDDVRQRGWAGIGTVSVATQISDGLSVDQLTVGSGDTTVVAAQDWTVPEMPDRHSVAESRPVDAPESYDPPQNREFRF
ncbi:hypothetical protein [Rhodococcus sp. H29-C3]|uniref:hypothetical protein n=1 Tax=Rhodococcus sp. H29-C3 TaxID=3046307 RepID=UPI0024BA0948|nr:hypothetical protein [Rhodococcus sp. H29-C3]MDJ0362439.1 hypothetical protein [Rhodococcus sp. H29-C3]